MNSARELLDDFGRLIRDGINGNVVDGEHSFVIRLMECSPDHERAWSFEIAGARLRRLISEVGKPTSSPLPQKRRRILMFLQGLELTTRAARRFTAQPDDIFSGIRLPCFPGFYQSRLDALIDDEIEQTAEQHGVDPFELFEHCGSNELAQQNMARKWVELLGECLDLPIVFDKIERPRGNDYANGNDNLLVSLPGHLVNEFQNPPTAWKSSFYQGRLREAIEAELKPRPGFAPYYPADPDAVFWQQSVAFLPPACLSLYLMAVLRVRTEQYFYRPSDAGKIDAKELDNLLSDHLYSGVDDAEIASSMWLPDFDEKLAQLRAKKKQKTRKKSPC